jgi:hypothetical protein
MHSFFLLIRAISPAHPILLDFIILITLGEGVKFLCMKLVLLLHDKHVLFV